MTFTLSSPAFRDGGEIPAEYTCDGADGPPPLAWSGAPAGTKSYVLIVDDPDAPGGSFTHWLRYDVPSGATDLTVAGRTLGNDFGRRGYGGPCPPRGRGPHRYVFRLHALDVPSLDLRKQTRTALEAAMEGHVLAATSLTGRYERVRRHD